MSVRDECGRWHEVVDDVWYGDGKKEGSRLGREGKVLLRRLKHEEGRKECRILHWVPSRLAWLLG